MKSKWLIFAFIYYIGREFSFQMIIKKVFIVKGNTGLYYGKYIDQNNEEQYIHDAFQCLTKIGCKLAINRWLRKQTGNIVYSRNLN